MDIVHDPETGKREMIERALAQFVSQGWKPEFALKGWEFYKDGFFDALAEQAILIECEVEHIYNEAGHSFTRLRIPGIGCHLRENHHGTPGKALAIVISLEEAKK